MTREEVRDVYGKSSPRLQLTILARLAHEMTVVGRSFYSGPQTHDVLIALNELQHQITGQQCRLADEDLARYPDEVFVNILFDRVISPKLEKKFLASFERAVSR